MAAPHNLKGRLQYYAVKKRYQEAESSKKEVFSSVSDNFKDSGALSTIVVLVGNGGTAFDKKDVQRVVSGYRKHYNNVILIGDGKEDLSFEQIKENLKQCEGEKFDMCLFAHGKQKPEGFHFNFGDQYDVHASKVFDAISKVTQKPVNMHIFSCHGGGALEYLDLLPNGSKAFSCCDYKSELPGSDVDSFFDNLNNRKLKDNSFETMLITYCASLKNRNAVMVGEKGGSISNLLSEMIDRTGKPLSKVETTLVNKTLSSFFEKEELENVIKKFENSGEYNMYAVEVGCAMAITRTLERYDKDTRSMIHHAIRCGRL